MQPSLLAVALLLAAQTMEPVAMALTAKGMVTYERDQEKPRHLGAMTLLRPGDRVQVPEGGEVMLVFLQDGHRERLKPGTKATVDANGCAPMQSVDRLDNVKLSPANLTSLRELARSGRGGVGVLRGDPPAKPQIVTPLYGAAILSDRPLLTWKDFPKAENYQVVLLSGREGPDEQVLWRTETKDTRAPFPDKAKSLAFGLKYRWRVVAKLGADEEQQVINIKFFLVTRDEAKTMALLEPLAKSDSPADLLLAAVCYEAHGIFGEALRVYERLAELVPDERITSAPSPAVRTRRPDGQSEGCHGESEVTQRSFS